MPPTQRTPRWNGGETGVVPLAQNKDGRHITLRNVGQIQAKERERRERGRGRARDRWRIWLGAKVSEMNYIAE